MNIVKKYPRFFIVQEKSGEVVWAEYITIKTPGGECYYKLKEDWVPTSAIFKKGDFYQMKSNNPNEAVIERFLDKGDLIEIEEAEAALLL